MTKPPPNPHDPADRTGEGTTAPAKKGGLTYHGLVPDTDPIYRGGWNFLAGKNLKPTDDEPPESAA